MMETEYGHLIVKTLYKRHISAVILSGKLRGRVSINIHSLWLFRVAPSTTSIREPVKYYLADFFR